MENNNPGRLLPRDSLLIYPGQRNESDVYICENHVFYADYRYDACFRCANRTKKGCPARIDINTNNEIHIIGEHVHRCRPDDIIVRVMEMRQEIERLAVEQPGLHPTQIYAEVSVDFQDVPAERLTPAACRGLIHRARKDIRPPNPRSFEELERLLPTYWATENCFRGRVNGPDGETAFIFISDAMVESLNHAQELFMDGTFKIVPHGLGLDQVFMMFLRKLNHGFPAVFVLMRRKTTEIYRLIFQRIKQLSPALQGSLRITMADFEAAIAAAIQAEFPEVNITGCDFHFKQAEYRYWNGLGLREAPKNALRKAMLLSLLPPERWIELLNLIQNDLDEIAGRYPAALMFGQYLRTQWLPLRHIVSAGSCARANSIAEGWNRWAPKKFHGIHPLLWDFCDYMAKEMVVMDKKYASNNLRIEDKWADKHADIQRLRHHLATPGLISMEEFTQAAHTALEHETLLRNMDALPIDNGVAPELVNPGVFVPLNDNQIDQEARIHGRRLNARRRGPGTRRARGNAAGIGVGRRRMGRRGIHRHDIGRRVVGNLEPEDRAAPIPAVVAQGRENRRMIAGVRNIARAVDEHVAAVNLPVADAAVIQDDRVPIVVVARDGAARDAAARAAASRAAQERAAVVVAQPLEPNHVAELIEFDQQEEEEIVLPSDNEVRPVRSLRPRRAPCPAQRNNDFEWPEIRRVPRNNRGRMNANNLRVNDGIINDYRGNTSDDSSSTDYENFDFARRDRARGRGRGRGRTRGRRVGARINHVVNNMEESDDDNHVVFPHGVIDRNNSSSNDDEHNNAADRQQLLRARDGVVEVRSSSSDENRAARERNPVGQNIIIDETSSSDDNRHVQDASSDDDNYAAGQLNQLERNINNDIDRREQVEGNSSSSDDDRQERMERSSSSNDDDDARAQDDDNSSADDDRPDQVEENSSSSDDDRQERMERSSSSNNDDDDARAQDNDNSSADDDRPDQVEENSSSSDDERRNQNDEDLSSNDERQDQREENSSSDDERENQVERNINNDDERVLDVIILSDDNDDDDNNDDHYRHENNMQDEIIINNPIMLEADEFQVDDVQSSNDDNDSVHTELGSVCSDDPTGDEHNE